MVIGENVPIRVNDRPGPAGPLFLHASSPAFFRDNVNAHQRRIDSIHRRFNLRIDFRSQRQGTERDRKGGNQ